jgi:hypothetical protein
MVAAAKAIDPILISARQAARALAMCEKRIVTMTKAGDLPCIRNGRRILYDPDDLKAWVQRNKQMLA